MPRGAILRQVSPGPRCQPSKLPYKAGASRFVRGERRHPPRREPPYGELHPVHMIGLESRHAPLTGLLRAAKAGQGLLEPTAPAVETSPGMGGGRVHT